MGKITSLHADKGRGKRVRVALDDKPALSLEKETVIKEGLRVGQELSASRIETLTKADSYHRCLNITANYLNYRPRSEFELKERLQKRGFDNDSIAAVLTKLKEQGLVDDAAFAWFWKENRETFSPRSQWLTRLELRQKGVASNIIERIANTINDEDNAHRAAMSKARSLHLSDYQKFRHRLGNHLKRRGFSYGVINHTVERVWSELRNRSE